MVTELLVDVCWDEQDMQDRGELPAEGIVVMSLFDGIGGEPQTYAVHAVDSHSACMHLLLLCCRAAHMKSHQGFTPRAAQIHCTFWHTLCCR